MVAKKVKKSVIKRRVLEMRRLATRAWNAGQITWAAAGAVDKALKALDKAAE